MRIEQLEYLILLKNKKSLNKVADELYISHQALGKSIKSMERELGIELIDRTSKNAILTNAGEELIENVVIILEEYNKILAKIHSNKIEQNKALQGEIHVYSSLIFSISILPNIIGNFRHEYPKVYIRNENSGVKKILQAIESLEEKEKHSFIGLISFIREDAGDIISACEKSGCTFYKIRDSKIEYYCSPQSPFANMKNVPINKILNGSIVRFSDSLNIGGKKRDMSDIVTSSYAIFLDSVSKNLGVGVLCDIARTKGTPFYYDMDKLVRINVKENKYHCLGYVIDNNPTESIKAFVQFLEEYKMDNSFELK